MRCFWSTILWNSMIFASFVFTELANTMKYGGGVLYNLVFTEWRHCVTQNEVWGRGCYITLFSPSDITTFHRIAMTLPIQSTFDADLPMPRRHLVSVEGRSQLPAHHQARRWGYCRSHLRGSQWSHSYHSAIAQLIMSPWRKPVQEENNVTDWETDRQTDRHYYGPVTSKGGSEIQKFNMSKLPWTPPPPPGDGH